ncbi:unnamed protein product [Trifolium pratense]|uniref:Uncharacterized protein n=1 Tax=Trifolium pratense TaxID=57577 RepID=A0ACB0MCM5_TRIPR|nr:unnamed protein product [Trifolium pratense]
MENRKLSSQDFLSAIEKEYPIPKPMENRDTREQLLPKPSTKTKQLLPIYLKVIEENYNGESSAAAVQDISKLSLFDLRQASYKDTRLKLAIRKLAPSVVSVSHFTGIHRMLDCSGFIIDWDDSKGIATVLTSAKLMTSPDHRDDYYIIVRLANGKMLLAEEDYVDYYHNIVTFKVKSDAKLRPLDLYSPLQNLEGVEVVALDRDFYTCELSERCGLFSKDYPYFGCEQLASSTCSTTRVGEGGLLITKEGQIIGINFYDGRRYVHPLPTSVIRLCLRNWNSHGIVMQPWLGFTVIDIADLPPDTYNTYETMYEFSGDSSVVVKEVYKGSPADKVGVRSGDSINAVNGRKLCGGLQEYVKLLNGVFDMLSACSPNQTDTKVFVSVNDNSKLVCAENLSVNDKNFCSSWLGDESDWYLRRPLRGSDPGPRYDVSWYFEQPAAESNTGPNFDVSWYFEQPAAGFDTARGRDRGGTSRHQGVFELSYT